MYHKLILKATENLQRNITNQGVSEYMSIINRMKKIPDNYGNHNLLIKGYSIVRQAKDISLDLKAQLRILLLIKKIKGI